MKYERYWSEYELFYGGKKVKLTPLDQDGGFPEFEFKNREEFRAFLDGIAELPGNIDGFGAGMEKQINELENKLIFERPDIHLGFRHELSKFPRTLVIG